MQIGLYEILKALNIAPAFVFGVSYGKLISAYAQGLSLKETIDVAFRIGKV